MYKRILLPTDGSKLAQQGLAEGIGLAKALNAEVCVVNVSVPLSGLALEGAVEGGSIDVYDRVVAAEAKDIKSAVEALVGTIGVAMEFVHRTAASPAEAILDVARTKNCDLIVMSSHGRRGIRRVLLGSQTAEVLAGSEISVLVVR